MKSGRWPSAGEPISLRAGGEPERRRRSRGSSPPPRSPDHRARGRAGADAQRLRPRQVSGRRAACSAALLPRRGAVALGRPGPHEAGAVLARRGKGQGRALEAVPRSTPGLGCFGGGKVAGRRPLARFEQLRPTSYGAPARPGALRGWARARREIEAVCAASQNPPLSGPLKSF